MTYFVNFYESFLIFLNHMLLDVAKRILGWQPLQVLQSHHSATERAQRAIDSAEKLGNSWPLQALAVLQEELGIPLLLPYYCGIG